MRPYCASIYCATANVQTCSGCRLESALAALGIAMVCVGLAAECSYWAGISASVGVPRDDKPFTSARAGLAAAAGIPADGAR
jgi:hypothetical protein